VGDDFPVLSAGPTPHTPLARWDFSIDDATGQVARWSWEECESDLATRRYWMGWMPLSPPGA